LRQAGLTVMRLYILLSVAGLAVAFVRTING
jgi:hypothetical protein